MELRRPSEGGKRKLFPLRFDSRISEQAQNRWCGLYRRESGHGELLVPPFPLAPKSSLR
jgi:hypothetical protein